MKISVVVPFFNEEEYIGRCIESLIHQDYPDDEYELILVDNNSTDASVAIASAYEAARVVHEKEQGDYAARNRGIHESRGQIVAFTDADTSPAPSWLRQIDHYFRSESSLIVVGGIRFGSRSPVLSMVAAYEDTKMRWIYEHGPDDALVGYTCNMAVRRDVLDEARGFPAVDRNAEIVFLRRVVQQRGRDGVSYRPDVSAERMEISSLGRYYAKLHTYGRDLARYADVAPLRALTKAERMLVFRDTARRNGYSAIERARLFALLAIGGVSYDTGRVVGRTRR